MQDVTHFKELDRMKSDFVSTVSHDLRSPLTSIKAYAQMLTMAGELNEKQELFATRIGNSVDRISALITDLLDISKIEAGVDEKVKVVDLADLISEVVAELQSQADRKTSSFVYHGPGGEILVSGNEVRLKQVIQNLVNNASSTRPDGGQISVIICPALRKQVLLELRNNGRVFHRQPWPFVFD